MENLEKLLPLLIIAASFIISIISSSNKAKKQQQETAGTPPAPRPKKVERQPEPNPSTPRTIEPVKRKPLLPEEVEPVFSSLPLTQLNKGEQQEIKMQEEEEIIDIDLRDIDEARRAFIYSEILSRKYV